MHSPVAIATTQEPTTTTTTTAKSFRSVAAMAASNWRRWSLQTRGNGGSLIYEGSVRMRESNLKKKERENTG